MDFQKTQFQDTEKRSKLRHEIHMLIGEENGKLSEVAYEYGAKHQRDFFDEICGQGIVLPVKDRWRFAFELLRKDEDGRNQMIDALSFGSRALKIPQLDTIARRLDGLTTLYDQIDRVFDRHFEVFLKKTGTEVPPEELRPHLERMLADWLKQELEDLASRPLWVRRKTPEEREKDRAFRAQTETRDLKKYVAFDDSHANRVALAEMEKNFFAEIRNMSALGRRER